MRKFKMTNLKTDVLPPPFCGHALDYILQRKFLEEAKTRALDPGSGTRQKAGRGAVGRIFVKISFDFQLKLHFFVLHRKTISK